MTDTRWEWLNYHHLLYFWMVAREGGLVPAARRLGLSHQTVSGQIHTLEQTLGEKLFARQGRRLALTDMGRLVLRYADEIFALGQELVDAVKDRPTGQPLRLNVGIADAVPKLIARELLRPAQRLATPVRLVCRENKPDRLLAELAVHDLDVVLSDAPVRPQDNVRAYNHPLGDSAIGFFAAPARARRLARRFPRALDGVPFLLPAEGTSLRASLEAWFRTHEIRPKASGEFDDPALLEAFSDGDNVFCAPVAVRGAIQRQSGARLVGVAADLRERYYAITVERRLTHPAVVAISQAARTDLLAPPRAL